MRIQVCPCRGGDAGAGSSKGTWKLVLMVLCRLQNSRGAPLLSPLILYPTII